MTRSKKLSKPTDNQYFSYSVEETSTGHCYSCPDIPELKVHVRHDKPAYNFLQAALVACYQKRISLNQELPVNQDHTRCRKMLMVHLTTDTYLKSEIYREMIQAGLDRGGMAELFDLKSREISNVLDMYYPTPLTLIESVLAKFHRYPVVRLVTYGKAA
jgi:hypothetical protein